MVAEKVNRQVSDVKRFIDRCKEDNAFLAAFKRADNPATEYQCWEYLAWLGIDLEKSRLRLPYVTVLSAAARAKPDKDGYLDIGSAIARCYDDGNANDQAKAKLRRLLACNSLEEICSVIRPLFSLISSKGVPVFYGNVLNDLVWFDNDPLRTKTRWAQGFFGKPRSDEEAI